MLPKLHKSLLLLVLLSILAGACSRKLSLTSPTVEYQYSLEEIPSDSYASAKEMHTTWDQLNSAEISEKEWLSAIDKFLESKAKGIEPSTCFLREYLIFPTLDKVLLPKYKATGASVYQEAILKYLVDLDQCASKSELKLQAECLLAISSGGYQYPGLNERLIMRLKNHDSRKNSTLSEQEINSLILSIERL